MPRPPALALGTAGGDDDAAWAAAAMMKKKKTAAPAPPAAAAPADAAGAGKAAAWLWPLSCEVVVVVGFRMDDDVYELEHAILKMVAAPDARGERLVRRLKTQAAAATAMQHFKTGSRTTVVRVTAPLLALCGF